MNQFKGAMHPFLEVNMVEYLRIGIIVNTFGLKGEVKIKSFSDFDDERYKKNNEVLVYFNNEYIPFKVNTYRVHKGMNIVSFIDYDHINLIEKYKGCDVFVDRSKIKPLKKGEFYRFELVGLDVYDQEGNYLGKSIKVEDMGHCTNIRIEKEDKKTFLVPNIKEFIKDVNLEDKTMVIKVIEGLI